MIAKHYEQMLGGKSVIRECSEFATARGKEIGYENVFDYSLGNPSVPAPQAITDTMIKLLKEMDPMELHGYSPSLTLPSVRAKVASYLSEKVGLPYKADHVFMTSAAASAIAHALRAVSNPGDEVLVIAPFFSEYKPYIEGAGAKMAIVPPDMENFQVNFEKLDEMLTEKVAALLINTPNNPSGVVYSTDTVKKMADLLRKKSAEYNHPIYLISDEPYREIVFTGVDAPIVTKFYDDTIMCYSFSKSLSLPGERIGYLAVNPNCKEAAKIIQMCGQISREIGHNCPSSLLQYTVAEHLSLTSDLSVYETNRNLLYNAFKEMGFTVTQPGGTFYIFPKALEDDAKVFCEKAKKYDLIFVPGDGFCCPGFFRLAYCIDTEKVERSIPRIREFVKKEYGRG